MPGCELGRRDSSIRPRPVAHSSSPATRRSIHCNFAERQAKEYAARNQAA